MAVSIKDITHATGLQPGSIYSAFKNKTGLFVGVIEHYTKHQIAVFENCCIESNTHIGGIKLFFQKTSENIAEGSPEAYCLLVRASFEIPESEKELRHHVLLKIQEIEALIYAELIKAQEKNEIVCDEQPIEIAHFLMTLLFGHRVLAQLKPNDETARNATKRMFKYLETSVD